MNSDFALGSLLYTSSPCSFLLLPLQAFKIHTKTLKSLNGWIRVFSQLSEGEGGEIGAHKVV